VLCPPRERHRLHRNTQLTDTYQETNGLLYADRTPKLPLDQIRGIVLGEPAPTPPPIVIDAEP
jgi:hypothetical protein